MMEKKRCRHSRGSQFGIFLALSLAGFFPSCATSNVSFRDEASQVGEAPPSSLQMNLHAELSASEIPSGGIGLLTVRLTEDLRNKELSGEFEGTHFPFFPLSEKEPDLFAAVVSIPYERPPGKASLTISSGQDSEVARQQIEFQVVDGQYPSEVLKVDGRRVTPKSKKDLMRIVREQKEIQAIYRRVTPLKFWDGPFVSPIQSEVTSAFGTRRVYNGVLKSYHGGLDLRAPMKTPIYSSAPGEVVLAKNLFFTGNTVILDHGYGIITLYCHLSRLKVKKGQKVTRQQLLGLSGKTGRVTGPHLHWQAVVHQVKVNPVGLIQVMK